MPFWRVSATFSAAWRHTWQVRNSVSPSFHSPVALSRYRGVDAMRNRATGTPDVSEPQLGVIDQVADDGDGGLVAHGGVLPCWALRRLPGPGLHSPSGGWRRWPPTFLAPP